MVINDGGGRESCTTTIIWKTQLVTYFVILFNSYEYLIIIIYVQY